MNPDAPACSDALSRVEQCISGQAAGDLDEDEQEDQEGGDEGEEDFDADFEVTMRGQGSA